MSRIRRSPSRSVMVSASLARRARSASRVSCASDVLLRLLRRLAARGLASRQTRRRRRPCARADRRQACPRSVSVAERPRASRLSACHRAAAADWSAIAGSPSASTTSVSNETRVSAATAPRSCRLRHAATAWANRSATRSASGPLPTSGRSDRHSSSIGMSWASTSSPSRVSTRAQSAWQVAMASARRRARWAASSASRSRRSIVASTSARAAVKRSTTPRIRDVERLPGLVDARQLGADEDDVGGQRGEPLDRLAERRLLAEPFLLGRPAGRLGVFNLLDERPGLLRHGLLMGLRLDRAQHGQIGLARGDAIEREQGDVLVVDCSRDLEDLGSRRSTDRPRHGQRTRARRAGDAAQPALIDDSARAPRTQTASGDELFAIVDRRRGSAIWRTAARATAGIRSGCRGQRQQAFGRAVASLVVCRPRRRCGPGRRRRRSSRWRRDGRERPGRSRPARRARSDRPAHESLPGERRRRHASSGVVA